MQRLISKNTAQDVYGVVTDHNSADLTGTEALRVRMREARRDGTVTAFAPEASLPAKGRAESGRVRIGEALEWVWEGNTVHLQCAKCENPLSGPEGQAVTRRFPLGRSGPWSALRFGGKSPNFELEETACASCGTLFDVQEVRTS